jgi:hypothetical protein
VHHHAIADHIQRGRVEQAARHQVEVVLFVAHHDRVARIVASLSVAAPEAHAPSAERPRGAGARSVPHSARQYQRRTPARPPACPCPRRPTGRPSPPSPAPSESPSTARSKCAWPVRYSPIDGSDTPMSALPGNQNGGIGLGARCKPIHPFVRTDDGGRGRHGRAAARPQHCGARGGGAAAPGRLPGHVLHRPHRQSHGRTGARTHVHTLTLTHTGRPTQDGEWGDSCARARYGATTSRCGTKSLSSSSRRRSKSLPVRRTACVREATRTLA